MQQIIVLSAGTKASPWFKCEVIAPIGPFEAGDKVYVKKNTEYPLRGAGETYWIFGYNTGRVAHVGRDVGASFIRSALKRGGNAAIATPAQAEALTQRFAPIVQQLIKKWQTDRKKFPIQPRIREIKIEEPQRDWSHK
jgi:hypothetical protein